MQSEHVAGQTRMGPPVLTEGPAPADARIAVVLVHGRGASARDILSLSRALLLRDVAYVAPEADGRSWYPRSFLAPLEQNEPGMSDGFRVLAGAIGALEAQGVHRTRIGLLGFSQGACLALEFAARHAARYAGVFALSGGLMGPEGTSRTYGGSFGGTPAFFGCGDSDPHVPAERVRESAEVFRRMGAVVHERIYPHMAHGVNDEEIAVIRRLLL